MFGIELTGGSCDTNLLGYTKFKNTIVPMIQPR